MRINVVVVSHADGLSQVSTLVVVPPHASLREQHWDPLLVPFHSHMGSPGELVKPMHPPQRYCTWHGDHALISACQYPLRLQSTAQAE